MLFLYLNNNSWRDDLGRGGKFSLGHNVIDKLGEPHNLHLNMIITDNLSVECWVSSYLLQLYFIIMKVTLSKGLLRLPWELKDI